MIENLFLAAAGFYTGSLDSFFIQLEQIGFFTYALPFLIIFALVFGVLTNIKIFGDNKIIYSILALSVSFMSLQFGFVSQFFSDIFPRMGVWLSVILVIFIIIGLFNPTRKWNKGIMMIIGVIILVVILVQTFGINWYNTGYWLPYNWPVIIAIALIVFAVGSIIANTPKGDPFKFGPALENIFSSSPFASSARP